ncbi:acyl-CoA dehydrogenase [Pseudomaricurvus alkylphenolicus]|uniref:acyl-CoA dehydrogenase family protein n=1 Tax=Pseudomaricurvus alkylphenolicus TaxID=1306991 RepID=UPI00142328EE|nr:acyl-CoA dehydrogenase family protein [Pseudomaricurvus alkylphenolicus]NIB43376.1 acyl-CoA dehydrogenase [Pseudomaricurvus alkylphenolicus]
MKAFQAPLDDMFFCLKAVADVDQLPDWDQDLAVEVACAYARFAEQELAPLNSVGDREGCRLEDGQVIMPAGFRTAYLRYCQDGWQGMSLPEAFGGMELCSVIQALCFEVFSGANHSLEMLLALTPGAARLLLKYGTTKQQRAWIAPLASGEILATMCLTEPGAGSDLSRIRCKAVQAEAGWLLEGEKIFISGGGQDLSEGILHLVLARTGDDGLRGLSLFGCQSWLTDGSPNRISVERLEEKMGLHASPTCQLHFDGAQAELIGEVGQGLQAMFSMMNHARIDVALQGVAHAARAHDIASSYAAERQQGRDDCGSLIRIDQHADVQLMLDEMAALTMGARAMAYKVLVLTESGAQPSLVNFLTPVVKVFGSEAGIRAAFLGQQVLGGYGYLTEYQLDQIYRDVRITAIYEGTNGIQAKTLIGRELGREGATQFEELIAQLAEETKDNAVATSLEQWRQAKALLLSKESPLVVATDMMEMTSKLLYMALWSKLLQQVEHSPNPERYSRAGQSVLRRELIAVESIGKKLVRELAVYTEC